ncbi:MAG: hypothetical protein WBX17_12845, partial [Microbacterium sp.]
LVADAVAAGQRWIATLNIHRGDAGAAEIARANVAAFLAAGGTVLYGTDLGNGDRGSGVLEGELVELDRAGVRGRALIAALCDPWPGQPITGVSTFIPGPAPATLDAVAPWLGGATVVPAEELVHDEP